MGGEKISPLAGKPAPESILVDIDKLLAAYADIRPDPSDPMQRVAFGTSGHRGSSLGGSFNEWHILAITQAICDYRVKESVAGPPCGGLYLRPPSSGGLCEGVMMIPSARCSLRFRL